MAFSMILIFILFILSLILIGFVYLLRDNSDENPMLNNTPKTALIKTVYFYTVSLIALMMIVFSTADLVNLGLKTWIFPKADLNEYKEPSCAVMIMKDPSLQETEEQYRNRIQQCEQGRMDENEARAIRKQRDAVRDISFLVVGIPLFLYHWATIRREQKADGKA
ncbi:MAG: hypothetical protein BWY14_00813 [Parcubacteria group bacterium ADurb.Bin192]|mgnify:CR=1 FL=1|nr:MAG: hypothetical protein BWY14_00813 [Parcubacteria group bacterium ADurb.Bin192]